jgi:hypothetical protein
MYRVFRHVLPMAKAWRLSTDKALTRFFKGLGTAVSGPRSAFDDAFDDVVRARRAASRSMRSSSGLQTLPSLDQNGGPVSTQRGKLRVGSPPRTYSPRSGPQALTYMSTNGGTP